MSKERVIICKSCKKEHKTKSYNTIYCSTRCQQQFKVQVTYNKWILEGIIPKCPKTLKRLIKIKDPYNAMFNIRNVSKTLRDISESVMRKIVGDYTFNEILRTKRIEVNGMAQENMQEILDAYKTGLQIVTVKLQDVNPPDPVKPAFNEVNQAKQEKEKLINEAWQVYNQKIPQAKGEALKRIKEAEGYALEKVNRAQGDAKRFTLLREEYVRAKDVTRKRLYLDTMNDVLKKTGKKYIMDPGEKGVLPLLKLDNEQ